MMTNSVSLRLAAVRELLPAHAVDALLVSGPENRRYLSGFTASDPDWGMVLITARRPCSSLTFATGTGPSRKRKSVRCASTRSDLADTLGEHLKDASGAAPGF